MSTYSSFADLQANATLDRDYRIRFRITSPDLAIMAIHGGGIEPGTTEIAEAVAGQDYSFYTFSGLMSHGNASLHITSHQFDEPHAMQITKQTNTILAIHGCDGEEAAVYLGGHNLLLKQMIGDRLARNRIRILESARFPGVHPQNICNRCIAGQGVQLELTAGLRRQLFGNLTRLQRTASNISLTRFTWELRKALDDYVQTVSNAFVVDSASS